MMALLRSDAYRVLRSRWVWVVVSIIALLTFAPALLMRWTHMGPVVFDRVCGSALSLSGIESLTAVMAAIVCCDRTDLGFGRTVLSSLSSRARIVWYAEKCAFSVLLETAALLLAFALGLLAIPVSGIPVSSPEPAWQVAVWLGCAWLASSVYVVLTVLVAHLTRSEAATVCFAVLASTGLLEGGLLVGADALWFLVDGSFLSVSPAVAPWLPCQVIGTVSHGAEALLSTDNAVQLAPAARALVVCLPLCAAAVTADALLVSRRDVA